MACGSTLAHLLSPGIGGNGVLLPRVWNCFRLHHVVHLPLDAPFDINVACALGCVLHSPTFFLFYPRLRRDAAKTSDPRRLCFCSSAGDLHSLLVLYKNPLTSSDHSFGFGYRLPRPADSSAERCCADESGGCACDLLWTIFRGKRSRYRAYWFDQTRRVPRFR